MGLTFGFQSSVIQQEFLNNIVQQNQQNCLSNTTSSNSNQVIIATNTKLNSATIGQLNEVTTDASCLISSGMQSSVSNILKSTINQTNSSESDILSIFTSQATFSASALQQKVTNNIYQISQASCDASVAPSNAKQYIYLSGDSANNAFVGQSNTTNANSSCTMTNFMKANTYNNGQGDANQDSKIVGTLGSIGGVILVLVIGVVILMGIFLFVTAAKRKKNAPVDHCKIDPKTGIPPLDPATGIPYPECPLPASLTV